MQPQEPEPQFELNQGHTPHASLSRCDAFLPRRASLSRCDAFLPRRLSPPSSPPHASIRSGHTPHASLSRCDAFLPRRLSPPSSPPHAPIPSGGELLPSYSSSIAFGSSKSTFSYEEFVRATDCFSDANYLGEGGFGPVHRGILPDGKEVAVKQLKAGSSQGEREFQAEVEIISRVHHRHLVSLVGYCRTGSQRLLAYEFVPNNTLEFHLHGKAPAIIDWSARQLIALGSAKGLAYLHEDCHPKIIHRDIKAANILLDFKFEAKVADFGLAKTASDLNTHVSTRAAGTFGYMDPEYFGSGQLTDKSDVYSYGVVLLELLTGRLPIDKSNPDMPVNLVEWARPFFKRASEGGNVDSMVDHRLKEFDHNEMIRMVACAEACTLQSGKDRPKMSQVVRVLEGAVSIADLNARVTREHRRS